MSGAMYGISFEVDVVSSEHKFIEIAGGGRYDKLVSNFVDSDSKMIIPSTGFAFGLERVAEMLDKLGKFEHTISIASVISFAKSNADKLIILKESSNILAEYFKAVREIEADKETRFDVYFGKNGNETNYLTQREIKVAIEV